MAEERYTVGRMFLSYLGAARALGLEDSIRRASPELAQVLDKPPLATARIPGSLCDRLYEVVFAARGRDAVRAMGRSAMRDEGMKLIGTLVKNNLALYGNRPEALLRELALILSPIVGNVEIGWTSTGPASGNVGVRPKSPTAPLAYAMYEGYLEHMLELAGAQGKVEPAVAAPDGRGATIGVRWQQA